MNSEQRLAVRLGRDAAVRRRLAMRNRGSYKGSEKKGRNAKDIEIWPLAMQKRQMGYGPDE